MEKITIEEYVPSPVKCLWVPDGDDGEMVHWTCETCFDSAWLPYELHPLDCKDSIKE